MLRRILLALLLFAGAPPTFAVAQTEDRPAAPRPAQPQRFRSPEDGFAALAAAVRAHDERALLRVLGEAGSRLIRSGDSVADRAARERFSADYAARSMIGRPAPDVAVLTIGVDAWPLPIPMRSRGGAWRFDAAAGARELLDRRIGRNELDVIETLRDIVEAQREFAAGPGRQGGLRSYAQRFFSTPGRRDGLWWPTAEGEPESPLGPLLAAASAGGYGAGPRGGAPQPFRGYYFRVLTAQGPSAPGGTMDWVVNGRMIGGFAVVAWPAQHGSTGWKTFMVSHDGVVWENDLGPDTARLARAMPVFDPGPGWTRVAE